MPELSRLPLRFDCSGVDLVSPIDRQPPGAFPYLLNARITQEGRIEGRPGMSAYFPSAFSSVNVHSLRRVNDPAMYRAALGYLYIVGTGTYVSYADLTAIESNVISGFSGNPLSLIPFNPTNDPVSWMYVYDQNQQVKIRPDQIARPIGTPPPPTAPVATYGAPAYAQITTGFSASGWVAYGTASSPTTFDRTNGAAATIASILYDAGTTGWACLIPPIFGNYTWAGERMQIVLNSGGGNQETVIVREIHPAINTATIQSIAYDSGSTGECSIVLSVYPANLERNSIIVLSSSDQPVRVKSVILSPDGLTYSIRCNTATHTWSAGQTITGAISWYTYTTVNHAAGETITLETLSCSNSTMGTGAMALLTAINAQNANNGRPIDTSNDYLHLSLFLQNPQFVTDCNIMIDIDAGTTTVGSSGNAFTGNYWTYQVTAAQILALTGSSEGDTWVELVVPLASGVRSGADLSRNLSDIMAIQVQLVTSGACAFGFDDWYLFGTYGPVIQPNAPIANGYYYTCAFRDSSTGSASVVGPQTRYSLNPLREEVLVTPPTLAAPSSPLTAAADSIDIYRLGGTLTVFNYVGTVVNNPSSPNTFADTQPDINIAANPQPDTTLLQPWPTLDDPWAGICNVSGTTVTFVSGSSGLTGWNLALLNNSIVNINGTAYLTYGQPISTTLLQITRSGGSQTAVPFTVTSPTLAGQPLPFAFGPLEGPFAPVVFALGDKKNGGTLYFCNSSNLDAASDQNTLQICEPTNELVSGAVWNGLCFCGNRDDVYLVRYSYLQTLGVSSGGPVIYQFNRLPSPSGIWSRWACARGPDGVYFLGRDGLYRMTDQGAANITDEKLYPLFPHDGQPAQTTNGYAPVDMTQLAALRISVCDFDVYFSYIDTNGAALKWRYEIAEKRWICHAFADAAGMSPYLVELPESTPNQQQILFSSSSMGQVYLAGGNTDATGAVTSPITTKLTTPAFDSGDQRMQKLYEDFLLDCEQAGTIAASLFYNDNGIAGPSYSITSPASRNQVLESIADITTPVTTLASYRNITLTLSWTGGPAGPRVYAFEPSFYAQPYIMTKLATQFLNLSFPGWKSHRRNFPGLISTAPVLFTIATQDGRTYGPYTIPSTAGRYRILPAMLDHGIKDLAFAYQLDGQGVPFAVFQDSFVVETKEWTEPTYIPLAVFKT